MEEAKNKFSEATNDLEDVENGQFQCPICMRRFNDPEKLIAHHTLCQQENGQSGRAESERTETKPTGKNQPTSSNQPINELELQIDTLQKEKKDLWQEISRLKSEVENSKNELKTSENTNDQLLKRKTELFQANETMKTEITTQAAAIVKLQSEKSELETDNENMASQITEKDSKINELTENDKVSSKLGFPRAAFH